MKMLRIIIIFKSIFGCFRIDFRNENQSVPFHFSGKESYSYRAAFEMEKTMSQLLINNVNYDDAGVYLCRVDFRKSPSKYSRDTLSVISKS